MEKNQREPRNYLLIAILTILLIAISSQAKLAYFPDQRKKEISISTFCTNFLAREVEKRITTPLENALLSISEIENMQSLSTRGKSTIHLSFPRDANMSEIYLIIRDRIEGVSAGFPSSVERPRIHLSNSDRTPVFIAFFQRDHGYTENSVLRLFTDTNSGQSSPERSPFSDRIRPNLTGIGEILVRGDTKTEILYTISPKSLFHINTTIHNLGFLIQNSFSTKRIIPETTYPLIIQNHPTSLEDLHQQIFPGYIKAESLFTVTEERKKKETRARVNGSDVISVAIFPSDPDMTIPLCTNLKALLEDLEGVQVGINRGKMMEEEIKSSFFLLLTCTLSYHLLTFFLLIPWKKYSSHVHSTHLRKGLQKLSGYALLFCFRGFFVMLGPAAALSLLGKSISVITLISLFPLLLKDTSTIHVATYPHPSSDDLGNFLRTIQPLALMLPLMLRADFYPPFLTDAFITLISGTLMGMIFQCVFLGKGDPTSTSSMGRSKRRIFRGNRNRPLRILTILLGLGFLSVISIFFLLKTGGVLDLRHLNPNTDRFLRFRMEFPEGTTTEYAASRGLSIEKVLREKRCVEFIISNYQRGRGECTMIVKKPKEKEELVEFIHLLSEGYGDVFFHIYGEESEGPELSVTLTAGDDSLLFPALQEAVTSILSLKGIQTILYNFKPALPYLKVIFQERKCLQAGITPLSVQRTLFPYLSSPIIARWTSLEQDAAGFRTRDIRFIPEMPVTAKMLPFFPIKTPHGFIALHSIAEFAAEERKKTIFHRRGVPSLTFSIITDGTVLKTEVLKSLNLQFTHFKKTGVIPKDINWELRDLRKEEAGWVLQGGARETLLPIITIFALLPCLFLSRTGSPRLSVLLTFLFFNGFALLLFFVRLFSLSGGLVLLAILFSGLKGVESTLSTISGMPFQRTTGLLLIVLLLGFFVTLIPALGIHLTIIHFLGVYFLGTTIFSLLIPFSLTLFYTD